MNIPAVRSLFVALLIALSATISAPASAAGKADLERTSKAALNKLVGKVPAARTLNGMAVAVLVFPSITKAGFVVGGQFGEGCSGEGERLSVTTVPPGHRTACKQVLRSTATPCSS